MTVAAPTGMPPCPTSMTPAEIARIAALTRYDILDTPSEEGFDRVTRLARRIFRTPMVAISLLDARRQWFKSRIGVDATETPKEPAFCRHTIDRAKPFIVNDALNDPLFADNPLVVGEPHIRFYAGAPLISPDGHALGALCVLDRKPREISDEEVDTLVDLARIVVDEMELRQLANIDALTGALSRRAFREEAARALSLAQRYEHAMSVVAIDLDRFKSVNDTHGHHVGDAVLKRSMAACQRRLRRADVVGRLGGEEFAVLLPHTDELGALKVAETLRRAVAGQSYQACGANFSVTASFGVATADAEADLDSLLRAADKALYRAKNLGRDRCVAAAKADMRDCAA